MANRYGDHYTSLPVNKRAPGSHFMKAFENARNNFDGKHDRKTTMQLVMKHLEEGDPKCIQYDPEEHEITVTPLVLLSSVQKES